MKRRVLSVTLFFVIIISFVTAAYLYRVNDNLNSNIFRIQLVMMNELQVASENLTDEYNAEAVETINKSVKQCQTALREAIQDNEASKTNDVILAEMFICIAFVFAVFAYIYIAMLRPFDKMREFANKIANGNFDIPLNYERSNYFGAFTWAFDNMRKEVIAARQSEKIAVLKNKIVIATISHDLKTPITSIRAYSESLAAISERDREKEQRYISVILRKCDEVTALTNDLLLHSISDLNKLKIEPAPESIKSLLIEALEDSGAHECRIRFDENAPDSIVMLDKQRFYQVIENLIGNSVKYAGTDIDLTCKIIDGDYIITIRDYGKGIPAENIPFVFGKFYRGDNAGDKPGSGLGLYITEYIVKKHKGSIKLFNHEDGLEAVLSFPIYKK